MELDSLQHRFFTSNRYPFVVADSFLLSVFIYSFSFKAHQCPATCPPAYSPFKASRKYEVEGKKEVKVYEKALGILGRFWGGVALLRKKQTWH